MEIVEILNLYIGFAILYVLLKAIAS